MRFSVITCTYNSARYLQLNIDSLKSQTFEDFEHVFIDGFSTDGTVEMIKKYQSEYPDKVKLFQFEPKGIANAMNRGIEKSSGEYLIHLHSDDSFFNDGVLGKIDNLIREHSDPDMIYGKAKFIDQATGKYRIIPHRRIYQKLRFWLLLLSNYIPHQSVFLKKDIFARYGKFDETFRNSMDYELWLRLSKKRIESLFIDETICNFSVRGDAQSAKGAGNLEHIQAFQKHINNRIALWILTEIYRTSLKRTLF